MVQIKPRTVVGSVVIAIVSSGLTVWFMSPVNTQQTRGTVDEPSGYDRPYSGRSPILPLEDPALIRKLGQMQAHLDALDKRMAELANKDVKQVSVPMLSSIPEGTGLPGTDQEATERASKQYAMHIENRFQAEETDSAWAGNITQNIQDVFLAEGIAGNSSLTDVDCRSSLCKLEVSYSKRDVLNTISDKLVEKLGAQLPYGSLQPGRTDKEMTIYLGKRSEAFAP